MAFRIESFTVLF